MGKDTQNGITLHGKGHTNGITLHGKGHTNRITHHGKFSINRQQPKWQRLTMSRLHTTRQWTHKQVRNIMERVPINTYLRSSQKIPLKHGVLYQIKRHFYK